MRSYLKFSRIFPALTALTVLIALLVVMQRVGSAVSFPLDDNVEDSAQNWLADPPWATTTEDSMSPITSWTDSPSAFYDNNRDDSLTLATPISLTGVPAPQLKFWHHYSLESGFDFGYVEAATSSATGPWTRLAAYSGTVTSPYTGPVPGTAAKNETGGAAVTNAFLSSPGEPWVLEQLSLAAFAGEPALWVRFRIKTDDSVVNDGWFVDDIAIDDLPTVVTLSTTVTSTKTSLKLSWSANTDANFSSYKVFRSETAPVTFNDDLVATIANKATTTHHDLGLPAKTTFHYRVFVVNDTGINSGSNQVSGITLAGFDYPFLDDMETSGANWNPQPSNVWARVTSAAHSGSIVWTDSPGAA